MQATMIRCGAMTPASRSFAPVSYPRRLSGIVRVAAAQPGPEPKPKRKLTSEELFERCEQLEAAGMSREEAKTIVVTSQFTSEWTLVGPLGELGTDIKTMIKEIKMEVKAVGMEVKAVRMGVKALEIRLNVVTGLVLLVLCFIDVTNLDSTIIGAAVKAVLKL